MTEILACWTAMSREEAEQSILPCGGSRAWASGMAGRRPFASLAGVLEASRETWRGVSERDWREAFESHPRIGDSCAVPSATEQSQEWSVQEQRQVTEGGHALKSAMADANREYEKRFGRTFIVCATGKSPGEILQILCRRLQNSASTEWQEAAAEQQEITEIRLRKWFEE